MMLVRHIEKLTKARSLFRDRKRSGYLTFLNAAISFDNKRGYSPLSNGIVPWYDCPFQLQLKVPYWILRAYLGHALILLAFDRGSPSLILGCLLLLGGNPLLLRD